MTKPETFLVTNHMCSVTQVEGCATTAKELAAKWALENKKKIKYASRNKDTHCQVWHINYESCEMTLIKEYRVPFDDDVVEYV